MAHIIVKIPHVSGKGSAANMVSYIAKREGVDKSVNQKVTIKPPTEKQMTYIEEMVKMCPDAKESFEYEDYIENPTRQNASALISVVAESNPQLFENRETYSIWKINSYYLDCILFKVESVTRKRYLFARIKGVY